MGIIPVSFMAELNQALFLMKNKKVNMSNISKYPPKLKPVKRTSTISFLIIVFLFYKWIKLGSLLYLILCIFPLIVFIAYFYPVYLKQSIEIDKNNIIFSFRFKPSLKAKVAESLYQIVVRNGEMERFRFKIKSYQLQVSPLGYVNGEKLLYQLKTILKKENVIVQVITK